MPDTHSLLSEGVLYRSYMHGMYRPISLQPAVRKKIIEAVSERGMGKSEAARTFSVSLSSVQRYVGMAGKGESLAPKRRLGSKPKLDEKARKLLTSDLEDRPFVALSEVINGAQHANRVFEYYGLHSPVQPL